MSRVRGRDTKPEMRVRKLLHRSGYRFRLHRRDLPGSPDLFLPKHKLAVFVHGCFWHGHEGCKRSKLPETHSDFWATKIASNRCRDEATTDKLAALGIASLTLWECELRNEERILGMIEEVLHWDRETNGKTAEATRP